MLEHQGLILDLLFDMATWLSLAKLRMHHDHTIESQRNALKSLGQNLRKFALMARTDFKDAKESISAYQSRIRRETKAHPDSKSNGTKRKRNTKERARNSDEDDVSNNEDDEDDDDGGSRVKIRKKKKFSLSTSKMHAMGHYPEYFYRSGTSDNYSTQIVSTSFINLYFDLCSCNDQGELEHCSVKRNYRMTNKHPNFVRQMATQEGRRRHFVDLKLTATKDSSKDARTAKKSGMDAIFDEPLPPVDPRRRYQISETTRTSIKAADTFLNEDKDPAFEVSIGSCLRRSQPAYDSTGPSSLKSLSKTTSSRRNSGCRGMAIR